MEWARIFGQSYGTRRRFIEEEIGKGKTVILAIDIQGARSLRKVLEKKIPLFSIFILPPSTVVLRERLEKRHTDSAEEIEKRIERAEEEIKAAKEYNAAVINRDLAESIREIEALISGFRSHLNEKRREGE